MISSFFKIIDNTLIVISKKDSSHFDVIFVVARVFDFENLWQLVDLSFNAFFHKRFEHGISMLYFSSSCCILNGQPFCPNNSSNGYLTGKIGYCDGINIPFLEIKVR